VFELVVTLPYASCIREMEFRMNSYQKTINKLVKGLTNKTIKPYLYVFEDIINCVEMKNSALESWGGLGCQVMTHFEDYNLEDKLLYAYIQKHIFEYYNNKLKNINYVIKFDDWKFHKMTKYDDFYESKEYKEYADKNKKYWRRARPNPIEKAY
tara:strand:- start:24 stop:485 length:462 start_codon:yes stop_codon:yes gene_type:complete